MEGIHKLWLIHRDIGSCIFEQTFEPLPNEINSDLISGFLLAILSFSQEIANDDIEFLQMKNLKIVYQISEHVIFALAVDPELDTEEVYKSLKMIEKRFYSKYSEIMQNYKGQVGIFTDFAADVEDILKTESSALRYITQAKEKVLNLYSEKISLLNKLYQNFLGERSDDGLIVNIVKKVGGKWVRIDELTENINKTIGKLINDSKEIVESLHSQIQEKLVRKKGSTDKD